MFPLLGQILLYPATFSISNFHICDGSLLDIRLNLALFSILRTNYGGDGVTTFGLPNCLNTPVITANGQKMYYYICIAGTYPESY